MAGAGVSWAMGGGGGGMGAAALVSVEKGGKGQIMDLLLEKPGVRGRESLDVSRRGRGLAEIVGAGKEDLQLASGEVDGL